MFDFIYVHNLSSFIIQTQLWGQTVGVRWYGLAYVLGLSAAFYSFRYAARRGFLPGLDTEAQQRMIFAVAAGVVGGGRLGYVLQHPARLLSDPLFFFRIWESGMAFFGGLVGVIFALAWTARRYGLSILDAGRCRCLSSHFRLGRRAHCQFRQWRIVGPSYECRLGRDFPARG